MQKEVNGGNKGRGNAGRGGNKDGVAAVVVVGASVLEMKGGGGGGRDGRQWRGRHKRGVGESD